MAVDALVGRRRESAVLRDLVDRALAGSGGAVLVRGEAGIGKSALVAGAAAEAGRRAARVLTGTCWHGAGAPGYWPWIQVLRALAHEVGAQTWTSLRAEVPALDPLVTDWAGPSWRPPTAVPAAGVDEAAAFALHDAVATVLVQAARSTALVIVLEDLQWADDADLRLTEMLVQRAALAPVAVLATERDEGDPYGRARIATALQRAVTVELIGLNAQDVAELVARTTGERPEPQWAESITARTGGNPFFVQQTAALWRAGGSGTSIPPGVSEALDRRLARLPAKVHELLIAGAVWGPWFDVEIVAATAGVSPEAAEDLLTVARNAGLLTEMADNPGRAAHFVHDLLRESLVARLPPGQARALHAQAVRAALSSPSLTARVLPSQLAEHAYRAGSALPPERVVPILLAAARAAAARLAAEEAEVHYERAARLLADAGTRAEHDEVALALGEQQGRAGHLDRARETFDEVASSARARGDTRILARAALGLHELGHDMTAGPTGPMDGVLAAVLAEPELRSGALAARVMAAASRDRAHTIGGDRAHAEVLSGQALQIARASGDPTAIGLCLVARHDAIWAPASARERLSLATEMVEVGQRSQDQALHLLGMHLRVVALLELGDPRALVEHAAALALTERLPLPRERYAALCRQAAIETLQGRFDSARRTMDAALDLGERIGEPNRRGLWADQLWQLCRLTGDDAEMDGLIADLRADGDQHVVVLESTLALDRGNPEVAIAMLAQLSELGAQWPRWAALAWMSQQAQIAAASGDRALCEQARADIEPWIDRWGVLGGAVLVGGPLRLWVAGVDAALGECDAAISGFAESIEAAERLSANPWRVLAQLGLAAALTRRGRTEDRSRATAQLAQAEADALRLGMHHAMASALATRALLEAASTLAGDPDADPNTFHLDGGIWTIRFHGRTSHQPDAKGLHDLRTLLSNPGADIPAADLADPSGDRVRRAGDGLGSDPVLDETARRAFRRRLTELDEAIDEAALSGEDDHAADLDRERQALLDELARATGLGGRPRRLGDQSERARKAVSARIRDALRRIGDGDPELAAHLTASISTGTACSYRPEPSITWAISREG